MLRNLLRWLPASWIRAAGRLQFRYPILASPMRSFATRAANAEGIIAHGPGAGLRFRATGGYLGYLLGTSEPDEQSLLQAELKPGSVVYDIGANVGFFSTLAGLLVGPSGRVFAFEPDPESAARAKENASLNGFDHVAVIRAAVGRRAGTAVLSVGGQSASRRLVASGEGCEVQVLAIDEWMGSTGAPPPNLVMIDVEGAELDVLEGMRDVLADHGPTISCEVHWLGSSFFDYYEARLRPLGYVLEPLTGDLPKGKVRWHAVMRSH